MPPHNQKELRTDPLLDAFKSSAKIIITLDIQQKALLINNLKVLDASHMLTYFVKYRSRAPLKTKSNIAQCLLIPLQMRHL